MAGLLDLATFIRLDVSATAPPDLLEDIRALRRAHPGEWELYRLDPDGYRLVRSFERRPDGESRAEALAGTGGVGLAGQLRGLNDLLEGLQR
jgi:hypothetical protein